MRDVHAKNRRQIRFLRSLCLKTTRVGHARSKIQNRSRPYRNATKLSRSFICVMRDVHAKNRRQIRFLRSLCLKTSRVGHARSKIQNRSRPYRNTTKLSRSFICVMWDVHAKNRRQIPFLRSLCLKTSRVGHARSKIQNRSRPYRNATKLSRSFICVMRDVHAKNRRQIPFLRSLCLKTSRVGHARSKNSKSIEALSKCYETFQILYMCYEGCPCKKSSANSIPKVTLPQNVARRPCSVEKFKIDRGLIEMPRNFPDPLYVL
jgi:hypothetical protein